MPETVEQLIAKVEAYEPGATPGPWGSHEGGVYSAPVIHGTEPIIGDFCAQAPEAMFTSQSVRDAHFAAEARTDLPKLAAICKAQRQLLREVLDDEGISDRQFQMLRDRIFKIDAIAAGEA
jgi:hypothetical protein